MARELTVVVSGLGQVANVERALQQIGVNPTVTSDPDVVARSRTLVFPAYGRLGSASDDLCRNPIADAIRMVVQRGDPVLAIGLGMHLLYEGDGQHEGLGILEGRSVDFPIPPPDTSANPATPFPDRAPTVAAQSAVSQLRSPVSDPRSAMPRPAAPPAGFEGRSGPVSSSTPAPGPESRPTPPAGLRPPGVPGRNPGPNPGPNPGSNPGPIPGPTTHPNPSPPSRISHPNSTGAAPMGTAPHRPPFPGGPATPGGPVPPPAGRGGPQPPQMQAPRAVPPGSTGGHPTPGLGPLPNQPGGHRPPIPGIPVRGRPPAGDANAPRPDPTTRGNPPSPASPRPPTNQGPLPGAPTPHGHPPQGGNPQARPPERAPGGPTHSPAGPGRGPSPIVGQPPLGSPSRPGAAPGAPAPGTRGPMHPQSPLKHDPTAAPTSVQPPVLPSGHPHATPAGTPSVSSDPGVVTPSSPGPHAPGNNAGSPVAPGRTTPTGAPPPQSHDPRLGPAPGRGTSSAPGMSTPPPPSPNPPAPPIVGQPDHRPAGPTGAAPSDAAGKVSAGPVPTPSERPAPTSSGSPQPAARVVGGRARPPSNDAPFGGQPTSPAPTRRVRKPAGTNLSEQLVTRARVPHCGWNDVRPTGDHYYFCHHAYVVPVQPKDVLWTTQYGGIELPATIRQQNLFGCQFHPAQSQTSGLRFLRAFLLGSRG